MSVICWVTKDEKAVQSPNCVRLAEELVACGFNVEWFCLPEGMPKNPAWFTTHFPADTKHVFLSGYDVKELSLLSKGIRELTLPDRPLSTICLAFEKSLGGELAVLSATGVDDFVNVFEKASTVRDRLQLRTVQLESRMRLEKSVQEQVSKNAKTETILGQREEFLSVCAHDLRSPLGLIQSSLSMILNSSSENLTELQKELVTRARRQAGEAINLVNDLLDVMSFEQGLKPQYQLFQLDALLKPFHKDYSFQAEQKGVKLHYENPVRDWRVLADSDRIRQLMQNLVVNALKFTEKGKNIYLNVMPFQGRRKNDPSYSMIVVSIKDEGRGIPQKELQKIFDRFTQVKDQARGDGRGLGLTVAKQISTLHDGNIWVQSVEGEGSTFFVLFPHVISRTSVDILPNAKKVKKVLIIEPSNLNRERYYEIMRRWGYEITFGNDGIEAVTLCFHHLPDLIVFGEGLAKMNEAHVADTLKSDPLTTKINLLLASETPDKHTTTPEEFPFDGLLKLPFTRESFQIALDGSKRKKIPAKKKAA